MATAEKGRAFVEEAAANLVDVVRWFRATERTARGWPVPNDALSQ